MACTEMAVAIKSTTEALQSSSAASFAAIPNRVCSTQSSHLPSVAVQRYLVVLRQFEGLRNADC